MARQWRIEYPGAIYHVLSRGNNRQNIFATDEDRHCFLELLETVSSRFHINVFAYVMMSNHYHLLLQTTEKNLSKNCMLRSEKNCLPGIDAARTN